MDSSPGWVPSGELQAEGSQHLVLIRIRREEVRIQLSLGVSVSPLILCSVS